MTLSISNALYSLLLAPCIPGYPSKEQLASHGTGLHRYSRAETGFLKDLNVLTFAQSKLWLPYFTQGGFNPPIPPQTAACTEVAGGTPFVRKTLDSFNVPTVQSTIMMDLVAYDGWPSLACIEDRPTSSGPLLILFAFGPIPDFPTELVYLVNETNLI